MGQSADEIRRHNQGTSHAGAAGLEEMRAELEQTRAEASETIDAIQERLTPEHLAGEAVTQARQQVTGRKERAADSLGSVAQALRQTGQQLQDQDQGSVAQYTNRAADQVERLSGYLRNRDVNQLLGEAERIARQQPGLFLGGAFALGLFGARFLKSSSQQAAAPGGRASGEIIPYRTGEIAPYSDRAGAYTSRVEGTTAEAISGYEPGTRASYMTGVEGTLTEETRRGEPGSRSGYAPGMEET